MDISSNPAIVQRICADTGAQEKFVLNTLSLFLDGATVPFIARYRKEMTGNMDELKIIGLQERLQYYQGLEERKEVILRSIEEQGKLTEELRDEIRNCWSKSELEDRYLPYKPKRQTKASVAMEKGLEPLAQFLWKQESGETSIEEYAATFIKPEQPEEMIKGVADVEEAIEGALHIIAEWIAEDAAVRKAYRDRIHEEGMVISHPVQAENPPATKYDMYYKFRDTVAKIPSHRLLAVLRGAKEGVLSYGIEMAEEKPIADLTGRFLKDRTSAFAPYLERAIRDSYHRLLAPSIHNEVFEQLKDRADVEAIRVFQQNLSNLLLQPPAGKMIVIGVDPGMRTGCKLSVVDETGKFLESAVIYPHEPKNDVEGATAVLLALIQRFNIQAIAFGNGTGSRETETLVRKVLSDGQLDKVVAVSVNEAGASVYSTSQTARDEFPDLDPTIRSSISIARRLQDPLAELVKVEPKSIGVGQYQHDVDQKHLRDSLAQTVVSCVNHVGVNINTCSRSLLRYVAGLNSRQAKNIIDYRDKNGPFRFRETLREINGLGPKTFEQAAGFLRIPDGENPLDRTAVHPERYPAVEKMATHFGVSLNDLVGNNELLNKLDLKEFESEDLGSYTLEDIREELLKPGRDPREQFVAAHFREDVRTVDDLQEGMVLEGTVSNVANFGAFIDIGVHHDGLVHISQLSNRFIKDPCQIIKVGDVVKVKVVGVDKTLKRISLSIRALMPDLPKPEKQQQRPPRPPKPQPAKPEGGEVVQRRNLNPRNYPHKGPRPEGERSERPFAGEGDRDRNHRRQTGRPHSHSGSPMNSHRSEGNRNHPRSQQSQQRHRDMERRPNLVMTTESSSSPTPSFPADMSMEDRIALLQAKFRPKR